MGKNDTAWGLLVLLQLQASNLDVVLGDSAVLSRQHAKIYYNFELKRWELAVSVRDGAAAGGAAAGACMTLLARAGLPECCWVSGVHFRTHMRSSSDSQEQGVAL